MGKDKRTTKQKNDSWLRFSRLSTEYLEKTLSKQVDEVKKQRFKDHMDRFNWSVEE